MFVVDTNILLYAVNPDSPDHEPARALVEAWRAGDRPWFITWGIAYEFLRVATHRAVFTEPLGLREARGWLRVALACPSAGILVETDRHDAVLDEVARLRPRVSGNLVHDLHTAVLMREHGIPEIRTADADFHQFPFLEVVNPLLP